MSPKTLTVIEEAAKMRVTSLGPWKHGRLSRAIAILFFRTTSASPPEADNDTPPHQERAGVGAPAARVALAKEKVRIRGSNGTRVRRTPAPTLSMNKAGRAPLMGLGFLFDSTLGYPGEGPSHSPHTWRGFRPSLRLWSSKRSSPTLVAHNLSSLDVPGRQPPSKTTHGNSDTSLGRWLHAARASKSRRDPIGSPVSGPRIESHRQNSVKKLTPSSEFQHEAITTEIDCAGPRSRRVATVETRLFHPRAANTPGGSSSGTNTQPAPPLPTMQSSRPLRRPVASL